MRTLALVHCFDHNYVLPAAVAFQSLLEHAVSPDTLYSLKVIGSDLSDEDRSLLKRVVSAFPQAALDFLSPPSIDEKLKNEVGKSWSTDLLYKLAVPELMPEVDVAVIADVDVVYADDVARVFDKLSPEDDAYVAGARDVAYARWRGEGLYPDGKRKMRRYFKLYSPEERDRQVIGAGLMVFNCKRLRADGIPARWRAWALANCKRLILPEQDVINQVCCPKLHVLPWNCLALAPAYAEYERMSDAERAANPVWDEMFKSPVQIHYASSVKPWKYPDSPMAGCWFEACIRAGLFDFWRKWYGEFSRPLVERPGANRLFSMGCRIGKRKFSLSLRSERVVAHG